MTTSGVFEVYRCTACGSLYPGTAFDGADLEAAYARYYTGTRRRSWLRGAAGWLMDLTRRAYLTRGIPADARSVLDYGCGSGEFLRQLKKRRYCAEMHGTDLSRPVDADAAGFTWTSLAELAGLDRCYQWVTLSHVLEHLPAPLATVAWLAQRASFVWISTPNPDSFLIRHFKGHSRDIDFPRHLQLFAPQLLEKTLAQAGFMVQMRRAPRINAVLNFASCVRNLLRDKEMKRGEGAKMVLSGTLLLLRHLLLPAGARGAESPEIIAFCKKL
jgi:hypothetical protein